MGRQLEADGYDMLFVPDALAMARGHDGTTDAVISAGAKGGIYLDPVTVMSAVAAVTSHLRLGCTISTSREGSRRYTNYPVDGPHGIS